MTVHVHNVKVFNGVYYYYNDPECRLISNCCLPVDESGTVKSSVFINCEFHSRLRGTKFEECIFVNCKGLD